MAVLINNSLFALYIYGGEEVVVVVGGGGYRNRVFLRGCFDCSVTDIDASAAFYRCVCTLFNSY